MTVQSQSVRAGLWRGLIIAALLILASAALRLLSPAWLSSELVLRIFGMLTGAVVVIYANLVPKVLTPLMRVCRDPNVDQAIRRFTGWTLALGGLGYIAAWMIAPIQHAPLISMCLLGTAVALVVARIVLAAAKRSGAGPRTASRS